MHAAPSDIRRHIEVDGFASIAAARLADSLSSEARAAWPAFADSWNDLGTDLYMADGGRYRRRRHAVFGLVGEHLLRRPRQPHYQSRDYNRLNGGVERWFEPVREEIAASPALGGLVQLARSWMLPTGPSPLRMEMHQFRIEANSAAMGLPTPEGMHRDGVDHVMVVLIRRVNVAEGVTRIASITGEPLGEFTLADPMDAVCLDDRRVAHGVTPIHPADPSQPAWRDALVLTFARED